MAFNTRSHAIQGLGSGTMPLKMAPSMPGMRYNSRLLGESFTRYNTGSPTAPSVGNVTVAGTIGTETFTMTFNVVGLTGASVSKVITHAASAGNTATDVATALVGKINADPDINDVLTATNVAGVISFTARRFRKVNSITSSATGAATITASSTITQEGTIAEIPFGYAVGAYPSYGEVQCSAISTATNLTVLGIARHRYWDVAEYPYDQNKSTRGYPADALVEIATRDLIWVPVPVAVAKNTVPAILNATGQVTANGAATSTPFTGAMFKSSTTGAGLALVSLDLAPGV